MWRIQPALTLACLSVSLPLWCAGAILFRAAAPGLLAKPRIDGQHDFTVQRKRARNANGQRFRGGSASSPPVRSRERRGLLAAAENLLGLVHFHAGHTNAFAIEPGDFVRLRRLAVCAGKNSAGQRTGGVSPGLLQQFTGQVANISTIANSVQQSLAAARRVFEVLDMPVEVQSRPNAVKPARLTGQITFEQVAFGYSAGKSGAGGNFFRDEVRPGDWNFRHDRRGQKFVARLDSALLRSATGPHPRRRTGFARPGSGRIPPADRHRLSGKFFVFQHGRGQHRVRPSATRRWNRSNARRRIASAHEFITALPHGYETVLGESGVDLSGGQRQRLALARALILQPPILILDDPTASVDARTENEIVSALREPQ